MELFSTQPMGGQRGRLNQALRLERHSTGVVLLTRTPRSSWVRTVRCFARRIEDPRGARRVGHLVQSNSTRSHSQMLIQELLWAICAHHSALLTAEQPGNGKAASSDLRMKSVSQVRTLGLWWAVASPKRLMVELHGSSRRPGPNWLRCVSRIPIQGPQLEAP